MKNSKCKIKNLLFVLMLIIVGLVMAPDALAADAINRNTGYKSKNEAVVKDRKVFEHRSLKAGLVVNIDNVDESTGGNEADKNTGGDNKVNSGSVTASVTTEDYLNYTELDVNQCACEEEGCLCQDEDKAVNSCTGAESNNIAKVKKTRRVSYGEISLGAVINYSDVSLNTGGNSANKNTSCGDCQGNDVDSGDAEATISHTSDVNTSMVTISQ